MPQWQTQRLNGRQMRCETTGGQTMSSFRFIHAEDIHPDSLLKGRANHEGHAAEHIRTATREAFDNLIGQAIDEEASSSSLRAICTTGIGESIERDCSSRDRWAG